MSGVNESCFIQMSHVSYKFVQYDRVSLSYGDGPAVETLFNLCIHILNVLFHMDMKMTRILVK